MSIVTAGTSFSLTSEYIEATSQFSSSTKVVLYVEGFEDISFWNKFFEDIDISVDIKAFAIDNKANGKGTIISSINNGTISLGKYLIVALDSDYDYLVDSYSDIFTNEFVFQTYAYSIENLLWHPQHLNIICQNSINCTQHIDNNSINITVSNWSKAVYPEYLRFIQTGATDDIIFSNIMGSLIPENIGSDFSHISYPPFCDSEFTTSLLEKGLSEDNVYLFVRGHNLETALDSICAYITSKAIDNVVLDLKSNHGSKAGPFIKEYMNRNTEPKVLVNNSDVKCGLCAPKIQHDINTYYSKHFS